MRLVGLMGGKIWLESKPGEGSTFHFTLRLKQQDTKTAQSQPRRLEQVQDLSVLIVDDQYTSRIVLQAMLEKAE